MKLEHPKAVFFLFAFIIYLYLSFSYSVVFWDTATFFTNARVFSAGHGFFEWSLAPFWPVILAICPVELFGRIVAALFGIAGALAVYLLGREMFGERAGFLAALLLLLNPIYAAWSAAVYSDVPAFTFMALAVFAFMKSFKNPKWLYAFGILMSLSFLTRYLTILVLMPLFIYLAYRRFSLLGKKEFWAMIPVFLVPIALWMHFCWQHTGNAMISFIRATWSITAVDIHFGPLYYYIANFPQIYSIFIPFFIAAFVFSKDRKKLALPIALFLVFLLILSFTAYKFDRHMIPGFLGFALVSGYGFSLLIDKKRAFRYLAVALPVLLLPAFVLSAQFFQQDSGINSVCAWIDAGNTNTSSMAISPWWVYWDYCGQKATRWYGGESEMQTSGIGSMQGYIDAYRVKYAIVSDYDTYPPGINTSYVSGLANFTLVEKAGSFSVFEYRGDYYSPARELPLEFTFMRT